MFDGIMTYGPLDDSMPKEEIKDTEECRPWKYDPTKALRQTTPNEAEVQRSPNQAHVRFMQVAHVVKSTFVVYSIVRVNLASWIGLLGMSRCSSVSLILCSSSALGCCSS